MANVFDQFDVQQKPATNPFDQFDPSPQPDVVQAAPANVFDQFDGGPTLATPFKAFAQKAGAGAGAAVQGMGIAGAGVGRGLLDQFAAVDAGKEPDYSSLSTIGKGALEEYVHSPEALRAVQRKIAEGMMGVFQGEQERGPEIAKASQEAIPLTPGEEQSKWAQVPGMVGYGAAPVGVMLAGGIIPGALVASQQGASQGFQDALAHGASLNDAYTAATAVGATQGALSVIPLHVLDRIAAATGGLFTRTLVGAATQAGTQGLIGAVQQALTNLEAAHIYDPQRGIGDDVTDTAIVSALAGGITGGALGALPKGRPSGAPPPGETPSPGSEVPPAAPAGGTAPVATAAVAPLPDHLMPSPGDVVGLNTKGGTPQRVTIDSVGGGHVFFLDEAGVKRGTTAADFSRDLTAPPEPKIDTNIISAAQPDRVRVSEPPAEAAPHPFNDDLFGLPGTEEAAPVKVTDDIRTEVRDAIFGDGERALSPEAEAVLNAMPKDLRSAAENHAAFLRGREEGSEVLDEATHKEIYGGGSGHEAGTKEASRWLAQTAEVPRPLSDLAKGDDGQVRSLDRPTEPVRPSGNIDILPPDADRVSSGEGTSKSPIVVRTAEDIQRAADQVAAPTDAQKESGNYQKGHVNVQGLNIAIETPKGGERSGVGPDGKPWSVEMPAHYGYVKRTVGGDGENVDVYLGDNPESKTVAVVDQIDPKTGKYDEHKAFVGFDNPDQVLSTYDAAFSDHSGPRRRGGAVAMSMDQFKDWLKSGNTKKPISDQNVGVDIDVPASRVQPQEIPGRVSGGEGGHDFLTESQSRFGGPKKIGTDILESRQDISDSLPEAESKGTKQDLTETAKSVVDAGKTPEERIQNSLDFVSEWGKKHGTESAVATDQDGNVISAQSLNDPFRVEMPDAFWHPQDKGGIGSVVHNHPGKSESGLSFGDLSMLARPGLWAIGAVTESGHLSVASAGHKLPLMLGDDISGATELVGEIAKMAWGALSTAYREGGAIREFGNPAATRDAHVLMGEILDNVGLIKYRTTQAPSAEIRDLVGRKVIADIQRKIGAAVDGMVEIRKKYIDHINETQHKWYQPRTYTPYLWSLRNAGEQSESYVQRTALPRTEVLAGFHREHSQGQAERPAQSGDSGRKITTRNPGRGPGSGDLNTTPSIGPEERRGARAPEDEPLADAIRAPDGRPATAAEIAAEASRLSRLPRDSTLGKLRKSFSYVTLPVSLASKDRLSAQLFGAVMDRFRRLNALENEAVPQASPYFRLRRPAMDRVNRIMEVARLYGMDLPDDGRSIVLEVPRPSTPYGGPKPELSRPGQVLALSPEETAAYHSLKGFFQQRLTQMGEALARSRGYDGEFSREAIQAQIDAIRTGPVPKRLTRALQAFEMTEEMRRAGYVPFNRYGDYYIRVRPIDPASGDQGGLWFVPKQSIFQDVQTKLDGSNEMIPVREKIKELRAQYPADRFHIDPPGRTETLGGKNVLMHANIPELEKIFMVLDRPGTEASAAVLDDLMDKLFEARKAGFRKQSQNVRGYCVAPDTKILTADMRWVEAKDLAHGDEIVGFDEFNREWKQRRKMRVGVVESARRIIQPCYKIVLSSGRSIVVSADHRLLGGRQNDRPAKWEYAKDIKTGRILKTFPFYEPRTDFDSGWFSGILDGEGWISYSAQPTTKKNLVLGWAQLPGPVLERSLLIANNAGLKAGHLKHTTRTTHSAVMGPWSAMACLQMFQPIRLIAKRKWDGIPLPTAADVDTVISVEFVGDREVVALQTSTQTFIANGICSHNSTDYERSIADYIRQSSAHVSNMEHRNTIDSAKAQMDEHPDKNIRSFWDGYMRELDTPDSAFSQAARKVGFFQFIWGSFASAATNVLQTPGVTLPALAAWTGPRAPILLGEALTEAASAIRVGSRGFEIDWSKVGRTAAERAAVQSARREGVMDPRMSEEAQGRNVTSSQRLRPYHKRMGHVWDAGASMFSAAESVNRIAAYLSHFRAAQNPQLVENMARTHAQDQNFQRMRLAGGLTPENIARFGVEDTQFIGGKVNRAPITRGPGAWLLQFKPYLLNYLRIVNRQATRMGWHGKMAFSLSMGALVAQSGLFGLPYAQDVIDLGEAIWQHFTHIDPMIEARIKQAASDSAMGPLGGELVGHGLGRLGPVDISNRTSMGQIAPSGNPLDLFPLASGTIGRALQFWNEMSQGRPWTAYAGASGLVLGKGGEDIAKAAALAKEGYATQKGNVVEFPSEVTNAQIISRGLGFQPSGLSRELEKRTEANRMKESTTAASSKLLTDVSRELALAQDATRSGNKDEAAAHYARYTALIKANAAQLADPSVPGWEKVPPIRARAIKAAIIQQMNYDQSVLSRTSKMKRGAVQSIQSGP